LTFSQISAAISSFVSDVPQLDVDSHPDLAESALRISSEVTGAFRASSETVGAVAVEVPAGMPRADAGFRRLSSEIS
jgi:hypothetical protein